MKGEILVLTLLVVAAKAHFVQQIFLTGEDSERIEVMDLQEVRTDQFDVEPRKHPGNNGLIADAVSSLEHKLLMKLEEITSNLSATNKNPTCEASHDAVSSLEQNLLMKLEEMTSNLSATNKTLTCEVSPDGVSSLEQELQLKLEDITSNLSATIKNSAFEVLPDAVSSLEQNLLMKLEEMTSSLSATNKNPICEASHAAVSSLEQNLLVKLEEMTSNLAATIKTSALPDAINSLEQNLLKKLEEMTSNPSVSDRNAADEVSRNCGSPFTFVAGLCLFREPSQKMTWSKARVFCQERGADLAVFKDANAFEAILHYLKAFDSKINYWIGGTDLLEEDSWLWIDGDAMPRGSPYWGIQDKFKIEPTGGTEQNCATLYTGDHFLIHDFPCSELHGPLCQYFPSA